MRTRWKQTACGILSGMLLLSGLAVPAWAEDATDPVTNEGDWVVDDITLDMQDDGTAWVTNCFQSATSVDVPAEVDGVTISGIQEGVADAAGYHHYYSGQCLLWLLGSEKVGDSGFCHRYGQRHNGSLHCSDRC